MNKYNVKILGDKRFIINFIAIVQNDIPSGIFSNEPYFASANYDFISKYGNLAISKFFDTLIDEYGDDYGDELDLENAAKVLIRNVIVDRFSSKWQRLFDLWNTKYDPLSPFDITLNESTTDTLTTLQDESSSTSNEDTYAFNSDEPSPISKSGSSNESTYSRENPTTRDYTRKGNIGNTSRQELVLQEREVLKYQIVETIFKDIATVLCRGKYIL